MHAVRSGESELVSCLLAGGADPNAEAYGETPLTLASEQGRADLVSLLVGAGARQHPEATAKAE